MLGQPKYQWQKDEADRKAERLDFLRWRKMIAAKKSWDLMDSRLTMAFINTERANQQTVIAQTTVNMHVVKVPYRVGRVDQTMWAKDSVHYMVKIWLNGDEKKAFVFQYSQGSGVKQFPTIREILFSFVQDALLGSQSFTDYCDNTGADSDSIKERRIYETCNEVLGWFQINRVYESRLTQIAGILQEADNMGDINSEVVYMEPPTTDEDDMPF